MNISVGDACEATQVVDSGDWQSGRLVNFDGKGNCVFRWDRGGPDSVLPFNGSYIRAISSVRMRKKVIDLIEEEENFRIAVGMRKLASMNRPPLDHLQPVKKVKPPKAAVPLENYTPAALYKKNLRDEVSAVDTLSDKSMSTCVKELTPFLTPKVLDRLQAHCENKDSASLARDMAMLSNPSAVKQVKQPKLISSVTMRDYQLLGLSWLADRYTRGINCILADEMGLGGYYYYYDYHYITLLLL